MGLVGWGQGPSDPAPTGPAPSAPMTTDLRTPGTTPDPPTLGSMDVLIRPVDVRLAVLLDHRPDEVPTPGPWPPPPT